jgi:DNA-binding LytR/AlgR family response regulator
VSGWRVLAVDDEPLALAELAFLLRQDDRVKSLRTASDGVETLKVLRTESFDVVFLDVSMPGLDGVEVAEILRRLPVPPELVFVTAHEGRAAEAFGLDAVDYVLKPVSAGRLQEALRRLERRTATTTTLPEQDDDLAALPVESDGSTRFVLRRDVLWVEAHGDYVRLTARGRDPGPHTVRMPLAVLEERWASSGFLRIHRGYLVALPAVTELRKDPLGGLLARVGGRDLPVSRRHARELRERLASLARPTR